MNNDNVYEVEIKWKDAINDEAMSALFCETDDIGGDDDNIFFYGLSRDQANKQAKAFQKTGSIDSCEEWFIVSVS
ncbi:hypothetical protein [uncultured Umboniibacter sp.]|uniref:hypothetical protein n=1 Tax=uncultured Umboniibacter sp. TaxID=1798917 RepID=UPI00261BADD3|nr:hypothetical protein [uncultured Umboniibacter sp.]